MAKGKKIRMASKQDPAFNGFMACYKGKTIAATVSFDVLLKEEKVKRLLGSKDLVIKHTVPEGMIAIY